MTLSPICARAAAEQGRQWAELRAHREWLCWLEFDPADGITRLRGRQGGGSSRTLTPEGFSLRSRVHEYGGGAYCLTDGGAVFVNEADQGLYLQPLSGDAPRALHRRHGCRYGDLVYDPLHHRVLAVEEAHGGAGEPVNRLVAIRLADGGCQRLAEGADFYASPRVSPDGRRLAWLAWNHPHQPWLSTRLQEARLDSQGVPRAVIELTAGHYAGVSESVFQPEYGPDGALYFISDRTGWWNLYRYLDGTTRALLPMAAEFGVAQWQLGLRSYGLLPGNRLFCSLLEAGEARLGMLDLDSGRFERLPGRWARCHGVCAHQGRPHLLAESPLAPTVLLTLAGEGSQALEQLPVDPRVRAVPPRALRFETADGDEAHGFYYAPAVGSGPRPLIVQLHGGPTAMADGGFDPLKQYWLQRGFALLDLNYRGSSGFGRGYRHGLAGRWGERELEDLFHGCAHAVRQGWARPGRIFVRGNSAGGYSVLRALSDPRAPGAGLCAGASLYGISDLARLNGQTHKFESRYLHWLIGDPETAAERYRHRSPIFYPERFQTPLIFFQGEQDPVVPAEQTRRLYQRLRERRLPVAYQAFPEERHGFQQAGNRARVLERELAFYLQWQTYQEEIDHVQSGG